MPYPIQRLNIMQSILGFQGGASRIKRHKTATWKIKEEAQD